MALPIISTGWTPAGPSKLVGQHNALIVEYTVEQGAAGAAAAAGSAAGGGCGGCGGCGALSQIRCE
jgi:hypothetical protein